MTSLGFENYAEALKIYLSKYRDVCCFPAPSIVPGACGLFYPEEAASISKSKILND